MKRKRARAKPRKPPGDVPLLLDFLNSRHAGKDEDSWTDAASLGRRLEERDLVEEPETLGDADLELAREGRRLLRSLLLANSGVELDEENALEAVGAGEQNGPEGATPRRQESLTVIRQEGPAGHPVDHIGGEKREIRTGETVPVIIAASLEPLGLSQEVKSRLDQVTYIPPSG